MYYELILSVAIIFIFIFAVQVDVHKKDNVDAAFISALVCTAMFLTRYSFYFVLLICAARVAYYYFYGQYKK